MTTIRRLRFLIYGCVLVLTGCTSFGFGGNAEFPSGTVRFVVPYSAGGPTDLGARALVECFQSRLGGTWIVENTPGGAGAPAMLDIAQAKPDGRTIGVGSQSTLVTTPSMEESAGYHFRDFDHAGQMIELPSLLMVRKGSGYESVEELFAEARAKPNTISAATSGAQTSFTLAFEQLADRGIAFNVVPFPGTSDANAAALGGNVDVRWEAASEGTLEYVDSGELIPLATGAPERLADLPNVPTLDELGISGLIDTQTFYPVVAPKGLPKPVLQKIRTNLRACVADGNYRDAVGEQNARHLSPQDSVRRLQQYERDLEPFTR